MHVQSARFTLDALELRVDGRLAFVGTKKSLLDAGIAVLLDADLADPHWATTLSAELPADPADGRRQPLIIPGGTRDVQIVALAREYWQAANHNDFVSPTAISFA